MYTVREIQDRKIWEKLTNTVLLQSWNWGVFQQSMGKRIHRLGVYKGSVLVGGAQVIHITSALRSHLYIPHGPVIAKQSSYLIDARKLEPITEAIVTYCRQKLLTFNAHYLRIDPLIIDSAENKQIFNDLGLLNSATFVQPEHTIYLDLTNTEEELLNDMSKTSRYDIKRGQKDGITVKKSTTEEDFNTFWTMFSDTVNRQKFVAYSKKYYQKQLNALKENDQYAIYLAYHNNEPLAGALIAYDSETGYYLHAGRSASVVDASKYAPKVLLWQAITDAKHAGKKTFNLYGIAKDDNNPNDPWYGLSSFKKSFGGDAIKFVGAFDYPHTLNYWAIRLLESTRRLWGYPYYILKKILRG